ncbi:hypothetical protein C7N43_00315 [Sphingobacteriales bacterium UPWRP_1]|nr:hypothetical protein BVG80_15245 [Sphingobacteriales bacterium TSM_CSM]PSJ79102.1 hypothetical protein C7N43_00315 [Sphingobacteriales bacterium UPWRP_1]
MPYIFRERRYTGETYFNKYLFILGLAIAVYGLISKWLEYSTGYSTTVTGGVIAIMGGFFPMTCAFILWFTGGLNIFIHASLGPQFQLSAVPTSAWISASVFFAVGLIIAASSLHTGTTYEDIYEKTDY